MAASACIGTYKIHSYVACNSATFGRHFQREYTIDSHVSKGYWSVLGFLYFALIVRFPELILRIADPVPHPRPDPLYLSKRYSIMPSSNIPSDSGLAPGYVTSIFFYY